MRKKGEILLFLIFLILMSCETDFETEVTGLTEPVVYALIDPLDEVHYIRLARSFKGGNNAFISAQNSDSCAFQEADVKLGFYTANGWKYNEFTFHPVTEWDKLPGYFGSEGEQLFVLESNLFNRFVQGTHMILDIKIPGMPVITSSLVKHLEPPRITIPRQGLGRTFTSLYPPNPIKIHFTDLAHFTDYELAVRIYYTNVFLDGKEEIRYAEKVYHRFSDNSIPNKDSEIIITLNGDNIFAAMAMDIPKDQQVDYRKIIDLQFWIFSGSPEFYHYKQLTQMATDFAAPSITNLVNGLGVFGIKYHHVRTGYILDINTRDSLVNGRYTRGLKFVGY